MISFSDIAKFFEEIEMRLVASLKRNLSCHKQEEKDEGFEWSAWQAEKLRSVDRFRKENADIVGEYTEVIDKDTRELMHEQFREGEKLAEETIEKTLGTDAPKKLSSEPVPQFFGVDSNKVDSLIQDITTLEKNVETAALRMTDDVYRQTLHRTQLALSTGSMTLEQAIDISVKDFLDKGINCIVYKDGRRVNIADYVRMALRTTETRAKIQGMSKRAREMGYDTVIVSQYSMCSDTCLPWQGRVYIEDMFVLWDGEIEERNGGELWGKSHYCGKWFPLLSTAVHKGLFHPNCRHSITVWIEGVSVLPAKLDGAEVKKKSALEQQQRRLENEVRKAKRLVEGTLDSDNVKENKRKLREAQKKLKEFIDEHPDTLRRDYKREKIYTADEPKRPKAENITLKSYGNAEKTVDKSGGSGIIKAITVADITVADTNRIVSADCAKLIADTLAEYQKAGHNFKYDSVRIVSIPMKNGKLEVLRTNATDRYGYPYTVLEINDVAFGGRTKEDIDAIFFGSDYTTCKTLREAVIHEIGHAKVINGRTYDNYERIAEELSEVHNDSISELAKKDGLELIAECEVLLSRGESISKEIADIYNTYTTGGG